MAERLRIRCASESLARAEPMAGTASRVRRWLVIEQPGAWGRDALLESRLDERVARTLQSASRRHGVRVLLARQPGWPDAAGAPRRVFLAHTGPRHRWLEQLELAREQDLLGIDLAAAAERDPPGVGRPGPPSLHLVCTNGRHDACCADRGRPVVRALVEAGAPEVWECSHVGGDRFAANVVCLPSGAYFGRVEPQGAARLLADLSVGLLDLDCYRGRSCHPPMAQVAEAEVRRLLGERRLAAIEVVGVTAVGPDAMEVQLQHRPGDAPATRLVARVRREASALTQLTCSAPGPARPWRYLVESVQRRRA